MEDAIDATTWLIQNVLGMQGAIYRIALATFLIILVLVAIIVFIVDNVRRIRAIEDGLYEHKIAESVSEQGERGEHEASIMAVVEDKSEKHPMC